jgi:tetratricopeptide (TPR) repeat protein
MKPSILYLTTLLAGAGVTSAGDSKALLQKALFAEEVEQNSAKAAELYQRMIDQAESAPKQLAVARYRLAKLHLATGKHDEALAQLQALANDPAAPAEWVAQANKLLADGRVTIKSNGGMTLDVATSTLIYQKDTTIDAPRFTLTAAGEIKIIYAKQADLARRKPVPAPEPGDAGIASLWLPAGGSDLKRINATGTVLFKQKPLPGITPFEASGAEATYEPATGQLTLSGGKPWIRREGIITRAKQANQTLTINANTITFSPGGTQTMISIAKAETSAAATTPEVMPPDPAPTRH